MKKSFVAVAVLLAFGIAGPAGATQKGLDKCSAKIQNEMTKAVGKVVKTYNKCIQGWQKCQEQSTTQKIKDCTDKLVVAGKGKCSEGVLDLTSDTSKAGKSIKKMKDLIKKKCGATDPSLTELADAISSNGTFGWGALGMKMRTYPSDTDIVGKPLLPVSQHCFLPTTASGSTTYDAIEACIASSVRNQVGQTLADNSPQAWAALNEAGVTGNAKVAGVPLGVHKLSGPAQAALSVGGALDPGVDDFTADLTLHVGAVGTDGMAPVTIYPSETTFTATNVPGYTAAVCVKQNGVAEGKICCSGTCGATLGYKNSVDVTRTRVLFGVPCSTSVPRSVVGVDLGISSQCNADSACNFNSAKCTNGSFCLGLTGQGTAPFVNTAAGLKRCPISGTVGGNLCGADLDCPSGTGCTWRADTTFAGNSPLPLAPCTGAETVTGAASDAGFYSGEMVVALPVEIIVHSSTATFGGDVPCNDNDTAPPSSSSVIAMTTGTVTVTMNSSFFGTSVAVRSADGVVPANACKLLAGSVTKGYRLAGGFTATGSASLGDTLTKFTVTGN